MFRPFLSAEGCTKDSLYIKDILKIRQPRSILMVKNYFVHYANPFLVFIFNSR